MSSNGRRTFGDPDTSQQRRTFGDPDDGETTSQQDDEPTVPEETTDVPGGSVPDGGGGGGSSGGGSTSGGGTVPDETTGVPGGSVPSDGGGGGTTESSGGDESVGGDGASPDGGADQAGGEDRTQQPGERQARELEGQTVREFREQQVEQALQQQFRQSQAPGARSAFVDAPDVEAGDDFRLRDGEVELSDQLRREFAAAQVPEAEAEDIEIREETARPLEAGGEPQTTESFGFTDAFREEQRAEARADRLERQVGDEGVFGVTPTELAEGRTGDGVSGGVEAEVGRAPELQPGQTPFTGRETEALAPDAPRTGLESISQGVFGPPGVLESELGFAVQNPVEAITGAPGAVESELGSAAFQLRDISRTAATRTAETVGPVVFDIAGEAAESVPLQTTVPIPGGIGTTQTAEQIADAEETGAGPETAAGEAFGTFGESAFRGVTEATIGLPAGAVEVGALGARAGEFTARQVEEEGLVEGAETSAVVGAGVAGAAAVEAAETAAEEPIRTGGLLFGAGVTGVGLGRAIESAAIRGRVRATTRGDTVDFGDITTEEAAQTGQLPEFETSPSAPTPQAVREIRQRAADQPETLQAEVGESVLFRSEAERLPSNLEATRGEFELPGLFASPEASPLRLEIGAEGSGSLVPRLPRPFAAPERLSAFEAPDIEGMPEFATGARIISDPETGGPIPDPTTSGARFLDVEAETGTAFVRPTGSRTTELEAIFPPGSEFARTGTRRVEFEGQAPGTLDVFRRVDDDAPDAPEAPDVPEGAETLTGSEILARERRAGQPAGTPVAPTIPTAAPAGSGTSGSSFGLIDDRTGVSVGNQTGTTPLGGLSGPTPFDAPLGGGTTGITDPTGRDTTATEPTGSPTGTTPTGGTTPSRPTGVSEPTSPFGPTPTGPTTASGSAPTSPRSPFDSTPSEPAGPPTEPPRGPASEPPGAPTRPPTSPPSRPVGRPTSPGQPPSGPPGIPGTPTGGPTQTPRVPGGEPSDRDDEEEFVAPEGTPFFNPIATGGQLLFGDFGGGESGSENPDPTGLFLG